MKKQRCMHIARINEPVKLEYQLECEFLLSII